MLADKAKGKVNLVLLCVHQTITSSLLTLAYTWQGLSLGRSDSDLPK
jgi:hypothetical protein